MIPVDAALFASLDPPRLAGSRCADCGTVAFPPQSGCARCSGSTLTEFALPDHGTLWTFTVQAFEPKAPYTVPASGFAPFGVGYVDLGEVIVESRLTGEELRIGDPMRLALLPLWEKDGSPVVTYAFAKDPADD